MQTSLISLAAVTALVAVGPHRVASPGSPASRPFDPVPAFSDERGVRDFHVHDESAISRTLRFDGPGEHTLDVRAIHGSIRVVGTDRADVQLDVQRIVR